MKARKGWIVWAVMAAWMGSSALAETGRGLPLWSSLAGDRELPPPFGVSAIVYWQDHGYDLTRLEVSSAIDPELGQMVGMVDLSAINVDNKVSQIGLKADAWLLPFLNVYALLGYIEGETKVRFGELPPEIGMLLEQIDFDYSGVVYGLGGTLAWGAGPFFAAVNGVMTWTDLKDQTSVEAIVVRPIVGVRHGPLTLWTGAMYQDAEEENKGQFTLPMLGTVDYDLRLEEKEPWNWLVGASYAFNRNWSMEVEFGFGERQQAEAMLSYRF